MAIFRPGAVAKRQQVSGSYIRKLFGAKEHHSQGTSFSEYVLARRMVLAHHMLTDQRWTGVGIASIAYDVGFGDLSYFHRAFERCYGTKPPKYATRANRRTNFAMAALPTLDGLRVGL
jgi:AraC-like DNA-binding protein